MGCRLTALLPSAYLQYFPRSIPTPLFLSFLPNVLEILLFDRVGHINHTHMKWTTLGKLRGALSRPHVRETLTPICGWPTPADVPELTALIARVGKNFAGRGLHGVAKGGRIGLGFWRRYAVDRRRYVFRGRGRWYPSSPAGDGASEKPCLGQIITRAGKTRCSIRRGMPRKSGHFSWIQGGRGEGSGAGYWKNANWQQRTEGFKKFEWARR